MTFESLIFSTKFHVFWEDSRPVLQHNLVLAAGTENINSDIRAYLFESEHRKLFSFKGISKII
jgi:hypothetical protein